MIGFKGCKSLFTELKIKETVAEEFPIRHLLTIRLLSEMEELDNA